MAPKIGAPDEQDQQWIDAVAAKNAKKEKMDDYYDEDDEQNDNV